MNVTKADKQRNTYLQKLQTTYTFDDATNQWVAFSLTLLSINKKSTVQEAVTRAYNNYYNKPVETQAELDLALYLLMACLKFVDNKDDQFIASKYEPSSCGVIDYVCLDFSQFMTSVDIRLEMYQSAWDTVTIEQYIQKYIYQQPITAAPTSDNMYNFRMLLNSTEPFYKGLMKCFNLNQSQQKLVDQVYLIS